MCKRYLLVNSCLRPLRRVTLRSNSTTRSIKPKAKTFKEKHSIANKCSKKNIHLNLFIFNMKITQKLRGITDHKQAVEGKTSKI